MNEEKNELEAAVETKVNLTLNKEDVLYVMIADKEKELERDIEYLETVIATAKEDIEKALETLNFKLTKDKEVSVTKHSWRTPLGVHLKFYNIDHLESLKRPKSSKNKCSIHSAPNGLSFNEEVTLTKEFEIEGYKGNLKKTLELKPTKADQKSLDNINKKTYEVYKLESELSELRYKLLVLDTDKSLKANFLRKIVETTDVKSLMIENNDK